MTGVGADPNARTPIPSGVTKTYYVSPTGSDSNVGTDPNAPLKSLVGVQMLATVGAITGGIAVLFQAGGTYHGNLALTAKNTGTATAPVVLGAYGTGVAPVLVATKPIQASSFTQSGGRWVAPITGTPERLFFGTDEVFQARFPNAAANEGNAVVRATGAMGSNTVMVDASMLGGLPVQGAQAYVRTVSWRRDRVHVDSAATSGTTVTLTVSKTQSEPGGITHAPTGLSFPAAAGAGVFFEGLLAYLDTDGEWVVDSGNLYLRPPGGAPIASQPVEVSLPGPVIQADAVENLVVQDLHLDRGEGSGIQAQNMSAGPTVHNTTITASYYAGIYLFGHPSPTITANTVTGSRNYGIAVSGAKNAVIAHNEVSASGQGQHATYGVGLWDSTSTGDAINHNFVHDIGQAGIEMGSGTGVTVQENVVVRAPSYFGDAGAIYWNYDGGGNTVQQNVFCKTSANVADAISTAVFETNGIYLDAQVRPAVIRQNTVLLAAYCGLSVFSHTTDVDTVGGPQVPSHTIDENVFVGSGYAQGNGQEGGQLCYYHAYDNIPTAQSPTLGQLRSVHGNVFAVVQPWQRAYRFTSYEANHNYGAIDGNTFAVPMARGIFQDSSPSTPALLYTLDAWRTASGGKDATSTVGAPQRTGCDIVSIDGATLVPATQAWTGATQKGPMGIQIPAPVPPKTQSFIVNATPFPVTSGAKYLVELSTTSPAPQRYAVYLTGGQSAVDGAASFGSISSDPTSHREAFVVTATGTGLSVQIVVGAAMTLDDIQVRPVTAGECAPSVWDRLHVVTNTTDAPQTYTVPTGWLDLTGAPVPGTLSVDPFRSVVIQRQTLAF